MINRFSWSGGDGRRRVRITREAGQSLVLSPLCESEHGEAAQAIEVRVSQICPGGTAILEVLVPEHIFVERKETVEGVRALFVPA